MVDIHCYLTIFGYCVDAVDKLGNPLWTAQYFRTKKDLKEAFKWLT